MSLWHDGIKKQKLFQSTFNFLAFCRITVFNIFKNGEAKLQKWINIKKKKCMAKSFCGVQLPLSSWLTSPMVLLGGLKKCLVRCFQRSNWPSKSELLLAKTSIRFTNLIDSYNMAHSKIVLSPLIYLNWCLVCLILFE